MPISAAPPRDVVADAIARAVDGRAWSGTIAELHAAIGAAATAAERMDRAWPGSAVALAACLRAQSDALRDRGLRMSTMPDDVLIEPIPPVSDRAAPSGTRGPRAPARRLASAA